MGSILRSWRIPITALLSLLFIGGAFMLAGRSGSPPSVQASTEAALLQAISSKDTDADGLHDWEESLYGTNIEKYDSRSFGMSDGEAVRQGLIVPKAITNISETAAETGTLAQSPGASAPGSLTAAFSQNLFNLYVEAKNAKGGVPLTQSDGDAIIDQALNDLARSIAIAPDFKTSADLKIRGAGKEDLISFAVSAENLMRFHTVQATSSETTYLAHALEGDTATVKSLESIAKGYRTTAAGLAVLTVPRELAEADLAFINALMRIGEIVGDFARVQTDPLAAILALHQYGDAVQSLVSAIVEVDGVYTRAETQLTPTAPGYSFAHLASLVLPAP